MASDHSNALEEKIRSLRPLPKDFGVLSDHGKKVVLEHLERECNLSRLSNIRHRLIEEIKRKKSVKKGSRYIQYGAAKHHFNHGLFLGFSGLTDLNDWNAICRCYLDDVMRAEMKVQDRLAFNTTKVYYKRKFNFVTGTYVYPTLAHDEYRLSDNDEWTREDEQTMQDYFARFQEVVSSAFSHITLWGCSTPQCVELQKKIDKIGKRLYPQN